MKKIFTVSLLMASALILSGCTLFDAKDDNVVEVKTTAETTTGAKAECLAKNYQWNDADSTCEKLDPQASCLAAGNQWNNKSESCDYTKDNCLAAGHQWSDERATCEYSKDNCLAMNAQWDEQSSQCETQPVTTEQKIENCLEEKGQWDYEANSCQKYDDDASDDKSMDDDDTPVSSDQKVKGYMIADIQTHNTQASCWAAIDGSVYDLTAWIAKHPGGPQRIISICGTDATATFNGQHGGQEKAEAQLANFKIGVLSQ